MNTGLFPLWAAAAFALTACAATPSPRFLSTPVRAGMTSSDLRATFGPPLRVEKQTGGGEKWFYRFGEEEWKSEPFSEGYVSGGESGYSVGSTFEKTTVVSERPVRLSPAGRVERPVPQGRVARE